MKGTWQSAPGARTLALQRSEQIGWVSKQLGHTSDEIVIWHSAKFILNLTRQDGSALATVMAEQGLGQCRDQDARGAYARITFLSRS